MGKKTYTFWKWEFNELVLYIIIAFIVMLLIGVMVGVGVAKKHNSDLYGSYKAGFEFGVNNTIERFNISDKEIQRVEAFEHSQRKIKDIGYWRIE